MIKTMTLTAVLGTALLVGCEKKSTDPAPTTQPAAPETTESGESAMGVPSISTSLANANEVRFNVNGMTCENCVAAVQSAITKVPGVVSCDVSLDGNSAVVGVQTDAAASAVEAAIVAAGFEASMDSGEAGS